MRPVNGRRTYVTLVLFFLYAVLLSVAALSELFGLGWFENSLFK